MNEQHEIRIKFLMDLGMSRREATFQVRREIVEQRTAEWRTEEENRTGQY